MKIAGKEMDCHLKKLAHAIQSQVYRFVSLETLRMIFSLFEIYLLPSSWFSISISCVTKLFSLFHVSACHRNKNNQSRVQKLQNVGISLLFFLSLPFWSLYSLLNHPFIAFPIIF